MDSEKMALFSEIKNKVTHTAKKALKKSNEMVEVTKLNVSVADKTAQKNKALQEIGKIIYDSYKTGNAIDEEIEEKCKEIDEIEDDIKQLKDKIKKTKNVKVCDYCNEENTANSVYCSKCGTKL